MKSALRPIRTVLRYAALTMATAVVLVALSLCSAIVGCVTDPDTGAVRIDPAIRDAVTNALASVAESDARTEETEDTANAGGGAVAEADAEPETRPASSAEPAAFSADWRFGGFNGAKAVEDASCQIKSVSVSGKGVTFKFSGGSWWGATHGDPTMRCCAFYRDGSGKWVGGFWEWGSPDRTYRAFTNIDDGYKGWDAKAFRSAKEHAFAICSKDGKRRSNVITTKGL